MGLGNAIVVEYNKETDINKLITFYVNKLDEMLKEENKEREAS